MTACIFCRLFNALSLYIAREWQIQELGVGWHVFTLV